MLILIFDCESNVLLNKNNIDEFQILQLSWIFVDTLTKKYQENDFILKADNPITNSHIHKITDEISQNGYNFSEIYKIFFKDVMEADLLVGHNLQYDLSCVEVELAKVDRWDLIDHLFAKEYFDTMKISRDKLKLMKYPKLTELYYRFFQDEFNAHCAMDDVIATWRCYQRLCV